jgi:hypothetical protein
VDVAHGLTRLGDPLTDRVLEALRRLRGYLDDLRDSHDAAPVLSDMASSDQVRASLAACHR